MKIDKEKMKELIETDPDFIAGKRYGYSMKKFLERYPDGAPDRIVAAQLSITEEEFKIEFQKVVEKLRIIMKAE